MRNCRHGFDTWMTGRQNWLVSNLIPKKPKSCNLKKNWSSCLESNYRIWLSYKISVLRIPIYPYPTITLECCITASWNFSGRSLTVLLSHCIICRYLKLYLTQAYAYEAENSFVRIIFHSKQDGQKKNNPNSNFLVFLGIRFETHQIEILYLL